MKENELIRMDEVGRITIPQEMRKVLKLDGERVVELHIEKEKLIIKKYSPALSLGAVAEKTASAAGDLSGAVCIICDTGKVLSCSSEALAELKGKKISAELLALIETGQPALINACDGGKLFDLCENYTFEYRAIAAVPLFLGVPIGCVLLAGTNKSDVFSDDEIKILKFAKALILSALDGNA